MAYDLEEQEQLEAIKAWWREYGKLVVLAVLACALTIAAFQGWRYYRAQQAERAAALFMQLDLAERSNEPKKVRDIAAQIIDRYGSTAYAPIAALAAAKASFNTGELDEARKNLSWAAEHAKEDEMRDVARLRLAGVLLDQKKHDEALQVLEREAAGYVRTALRRSARRRACGAGEACGSARGVRGCAAEERREESLPAHPRTEARRGG